MKTPTLLLPLLCSLACSAESEWAPPQCDESCDEAQGTAFLHVFRNEGGPIRAEVETELLPDELRAIAYASQNRDDPSKIDVGLRFFRTQEADIDVKGLPELYTTRDWDPAGVFLEMPFSLSRIGLMARGETDLPLSLSYDVWAHDFLADDFVSRSVDDEWVVMYHAFARTAPSEELAVYTILKPATGEKILVSLQGEESSDWRALSHGRAYAIGYAPSTDELSVEVLGEL